MTREKKEITDTRIKMGANVSPKALESGRSLVSALFMAVRTAQIHDPSNKAFENAVQAANQAASTLFSATGGFSLQLVDDSAFINGARIRVQGSMFETVRALKAIFDVNELGGLKLERPPTFELIKKLVLQLAGANPSGKPGTLQLAGAEVGLLGVQKFQDTGKTPQVDRRTYAARCYAKLIIAVREQIERVEANRAAGGPSGARPAQIRIVRVIRDLIELCAERADILVRLASSTKGGTMMELHGANTCLFAIVMAHALGAGRQDLVDVGLAALFHAAGGEEDASASSSRSLAWMMAEGGVTRSNYTRLAVVAEQGATPGAEIHTFSSLVAVAAAYDLMTRGGIEGAKPKAPQDALALLEGGYDPRMVDLLINVLRAYPVGCEVMLRSGRRAKVASHAGGSRWDRPVVRTIAEPPENVDLMLREEDRFLDQIVGTCLHLGKV